MTLTNTQVSEIRLLATDIVDPFLVTAEWIEILYGQASSDMNTTVYNVMAVMKAKLAADLTRMGHKPEAQAKQDRLDALCERMKTYEDKYAIGSTMSVTTADLGLDTDLDSETASSLLWDWL
jgi:hypothetical protein